MDAAERIGHPVIRLALTGSTNDEAKRRALAGAPGGLLVRADQQTDGRGRQGRVWVSPPGLGLYASYVLRPPWSADDAPWLGVLAGLAMLQFARSIHVPAARLKWPNDLLAGDRKLGGALVEPRLEGARLDFVVVGIGINVAHGDRDWPPFLDGAAVSLRQLGIRMELDGACEALSEAIDQVYRRALREGPARLLADWTAGSGRPDLPYLA